MTRFIELGLSKPVLEVLNDLNIETPTEIQEKAIPLALAGKDIIGGSATGSGKTLAFAAPLLENLKPSGFVQALILTPTRELAEQVSKSITHFAKNKDLNVLPVYGGASMNIQIRKLAGTDIVVGTPGRILDHLRRNTLRLEHVKILILDEVDRMFDMGFHKDVESIIKQTPEKRQTMLFSATVSSDIDHLAKKHTKDAIEISVESYVDAKKLKQIYYDIPTNMKFSLFVHLLKRESADLVMVFCSTRRNVDFIEKNLKLQGINAQAIHGGLSQNQRSRVLKDFHGKGVGVMVCTDVAARGLDIKDVSHVYNYDLPPTSQDYIHRIGRTARAGEEGIAINILSQRDYENFGNILRDDSIKIDRADTPKFEMISIRTEPRGNRAGRFNPRRDSRKPKQSTYSRGGRSDSRGPRKSSYGRTNSRGSRSDSPRSPRSDSRGPRSNNGKTFSRRPSRR
jgi:ATP-dependent RNA helicase DeaD